MLLLSSFAILLLVFCVSMKRRFEIVLPFFVGICILLCFILSMFQRLHYFLPIVCLISVGAIVFFGWQVARKALPLRTLLEYFFTPGLLAFVLLTCFCLYVTSGHIVHVTDDINYWAIEVTSIFSHNGLVDRSFHLSPNFMTYTPGMQLFQWIGATVLGECTDAIMYAMRAVFYVVFLLPFSSRVTWKKAYLLPIFLLFVVCMPTIFFRDTYSILRVDAALGVCLGSALYQTLRIFKTEKSNWFEVTSLAITLSILFLVKQIGIIWAFMPITLLLVLDRKKSIPCSKKLMLFAIPSVTLCVWIVFCSMNRLTDIHTNSINSNLSELLNGTWNSPNLSLLPKALWDAFTCAPGVGWIGSNIPMLAWTIIIISLPLFLSLVNPHKTVKLKGISIWLSVCFLAMILGFSIAFPFAFFREFYSFINENIPRLQYLLERYLNQYFLGALLLCIAWLLEEKSTKLRNAFLLCFSLFLIATANWSHLQAYLVPSQYPGEEPYDIAIYQEVNFWIDDMEEPEKAIVLYGIDPTPAEFNRLQYALAPTKIVVFYDDISEMEFINLLRDNRVTHVVSIDETNPTYAYALIFSEDGYFETMAPYQVTWDGDVPVLVY